MSNITPSTEFASVQIRQRPDVPERSRFRAGIKLKIARASQFHSKTLNTFMHVYSVRAGLEVEQLARMHQLRENDRTSHVDTTTPTTVAIAFAETLEPESLSLQEPSIPAPCRRHDDEDLRTSTPVSASAMNACFRHSFDCDCEAARWSSAKGRAFPFGSASMRVAVDSDHSKCFVWCVLCDLLGIPILIRVPPLTYRFARMAPSHTANIKP
ncbi:hypothetical protein EW146_g3701 [Bondarzewia mesenterica]|uniref:Uncharacterized protein n=1 Tax=Bondarzewia mesenterica TaxID=1095465 RepID=A0A4S4LXC7_9AGAM|nr:hypothetical protein EW146_g3701 [Bondarzewia mesenterica]